MLRKKTEKGNHLGSTIKIASERGSRRQEEERCSDENEERVANGCGMAEDVEVKYKVYARDAREKDEEMMASGREGLRKYCSLAEQYRRNQQKIERLSLKLQQLYQHYQHQTQRYSSKNTQTPTITALQRQNLQLQQDIHNVRKLLETSLLQSQKQRLCAYFSPS